jgi:Tol biopolymer transport system component
VQPSTPRARARWLPWLVAGLALVSTLAIALIHFRELPPSVQPVRFQIQSPDRLPIDGFALSPDGRYVAFATGGGGRGFLRAATKMWLRPMDALDARALPGTDGLATGLDQIFWSPDSTSIGFIAQAKLKKISITGGPPQTLLTDVSSVARASWGPNGVILLVRTSNAPIQRMADTGSVPTFVTKLTDGYRLQPQMLPDGRHYVYYMNAADTSGIFTASLDNNTSPKRLLPDATTVRYAPSVTSGRSGYLLFARDTTLMAQPFDAVTQTLHGQMFPIAESAVRFSASQSGAIAYMLTGPAFGGAPQELVWLDRSGKQVAVAAQMGEYRDVRLSPDNKSIVFDKTEAGNADIWVMDLARGVPSRITFDPQTDNLPIWSPDGLRILWPSRRAGALFDLYVRVATGAGSDERFIPMGTATGWGTDWSRDGKFVLYQRPSEKTGQDLWIAPLSADASGTREKPFAYLASAFNEANGAFSPDGHWIAYESDESGRPEVYVQAFPLTNQKARISSAGGTDAAWSPNGGELFYLAANRNLTVVSYRATATTFEAGVSQELFAVPGNVVRRSYAVSADGRRFLVGKPREESVVEPLNVILNWEEALKQTVPRR